MSKCEPVLTKTADDAVDKAVDRDFQDSIKNYKPAKRSDGEVGWTAIGSVAGGVGGYLLSKLIHKKPSLLLRLLYTAGGAALGGGGTAYALKNMTSGGKTLSRIQQETELRNRDDIAKHLGNIKKIYEDNAKQDELDSRIAATSGKLIAGTLATAPTVLAGGYIGGNIDKARMISRTQARLATDLRTAERRMLADGISQAEIDRQLGPARQAYADQEFNALRQNSTLRGRIKAGLRTLFNNSEYAGTYQTTQTPTVETAATRPAVASRDFARTRNALRADYKAGRRIGKATGLIPAAMTALSIWDTWKPSSLSQEAQDAINNEKQQISDIVSKLK